MLPPFAALEHQANAAVMATLTNALASIGGAAPIPVIFDNDYVLAEVGATGMAATAPAITVPTASVPSPHRGVAVSVQSNGGTSAWRIAEHHPDGTGLSVLLLERAA